MAELAVRLGPQWPERVKVFGSSERAVSFVQGTIIVRDLRNLKPDDVEGQTLLHLAYRGAEQTSAGANAFVADNQAIDDLVLRAMEAGRPSAVFVSSSGAAAQAAAGVGGGLYGATKLVQEARFLDFAAQRQVQTLVGRVFNVAGPYANKLESYALSAFIEQALSTGEIWIHAQCPVFRSYLHVCDLASLVLGELELQEPLPVRPVDMCGALVVEMNDLASEVAHYLGLKVDAINRPPVDWGRSSRYLGDATPVISMTLKQRRHLAPFSQQVIDTIEYIRMLKNIEI
jgi:nucleoside-diphosphate-sugar epimerase